MPTRAMSGCVSFSLRYFEREPLSAGGKAPRPDKKIAYSVSPAGMIACWFFCSLLTAAIGARMTNCRLLSAAVLAVAESRIASWKLQSKGVLPANVGAFIPSLYSPKGNGNSLRRRRRSISLHEKSRRMLFLAAAKRIKRRRPPFLMEKVTSCNHLPYSEIVRYVDEFYILSFGKSRAEQRKVAKMACFFPYRGV